ncbi:MAG TPA: VWA domain-containing protein [Thermoanaerobaculia bacterium]|nr:VWA domain-containing protein [Thermoanaerobaculia bacterium]
MCKRQSLITSLLLAASLLVVSTPLAASTSVAVDRHDAPPDRVRDVALQTAYEGAAGDGSLGRLEVRFPGQRLSRTLVQWVLALASTLIEKNEHGFYNVRLSGEVRQQEGAVDRFDYRFDIPAPEIDGEPLALVFDRDLRPGRYRLSLEVEDLLSGRSFRTEDDVEVPAFAGSERPSPVLATAGDARPQGAGASSSPADPFGPEATAPSGSPVPAIAIQPPRTPILVGHHRLAADVRGEGVERVTFLLDDRPVMTKTRPPYEVELDLGDRAEVRKLTVEAWGTGAEEPLARDELMLNTGQQRFAVRLVSPIAGGQPDAASLTARSRLEVPAGESLSRLEYHLGDRPVATVDRPPFDRAVVLGRVDGPTAVRVVAHLADGRSAEDTVLVGTAALGERVDVHMVELYTSVVDRRGRAVDGLIADDFRVIEDGTPQRLARLERVSDRPLHVALVVDVSGSMRGGLDAIGRAARDLLAVALDEQDRTAIITFDRFPRLAVDFTSDRALLANGLTALRAGGGTELHEGLLFALRRFDDVSGQRVVLLFSDGKEGSDHLASEAVLEYARRSGVTVYSIGLAIPRQDRDERDLLQRLARDTGGSAYFVDRPEEVASVAGEVERDMRSRYLLAYQSSNPSGDGFRVVAVEVGRPGAEARTVRGYYP